MVKFLGGVRDRAATRAFLPVGSDSLVAVDLATGALLWRRERAGRPLAATATRLVTLDAIGHRPALRSIDAASGVDTGWIDNLAMPDWAIETLLTSDQIDLAASETAEGLRLDWRVRGAYRGGAPPPRAVAEAARREDAGAVLVDLQTRQARQIPPAPHPPSGAQDDAGASVLTSRSPDAIALDRVGDRSFALTVQSAKGRSAVRLEASDTATGVTVWKTTLGEHDDRGPGPMRK